MKIYIYFCVALLMLLCLTHCTEDSQVTPEPNTTDILAKNTPPQTDLNDDDAIEIFSFLLAGLMEGETGKEEAMSDRFTDLFFSSENLGKDRSLFSFLANYTEEEMHDAYNSYGSSYKPLYSGSF